MRPFVQRLEETYQDQIEFHILNIDHLSTRKLVLTYDVVGIPMIVLLNADGSLYTRLVGFQSEEQLEDAITTLLAHQTGQ